MSKKKIIGAALAAVALAILPASVFWFHAISLGQLAAASLAVVGVVTFTYESFQVGGAFGGGFAGGSNVAPTAAQAQQVPAMSALVGFTDADTTLTFTHNWGLSTAQATALFPEVLWAIDSIDSGRYAFGAPDSHRESFGECQRRCLHRNHLGRLRLHSGDHPTPAAFGRAVGGDVWR